MYEAVFCEGTTLCNSHMAKVHVCPGVSLPIFFLLDRRGKGSKTAVLLCILENAVEGRTAICIVFPDREKVHAEIQSFLNITDSVVENRKMGPGRDLPDRKSVV